MTVQELIDALHARRPDAEIVIACEHDSSFHHTLAAVHIREDKVVILPSQR